MMYRCKMAELICTEESLIFGKSGVGDTPPPHTHTHTHTDAQTHKRKQQGGLFHLDSWPNPRVHAGVHKRLIKIHHQHKLALPQKTLLIEFSHTAGSLKNMKVNVTMLKMGDDCAEKYKTLRKKKKERDQFCDKRKNKKR